MPYCRYCGTEITYKRTKNEKWVPCDFATGEPHFCREDREKAEKKGLEVRDTGILPCPKCGKPTFLKEEPGRYMRYDYTTLLPHRCLKIDVQKYSRYKAKTEKLRKLTVLTDVKTAGKESGKTAGKTVRKPSSTKKDG